MYAIFKRGNFPKSLKIANIIALLKPGKPTDNLVSYRPHSFIEYTIKTHRDTNPIKDIPSNRTLHSDPPGRFSAQQKLL